MSDLSLKHIYKVYPNGTKAVNDFNMNIRDKEFIVFVGPSGCGKSTVLRMIAGLEPITAGELKIGDVVVNDVEPKDRDIAMVFQNYALYPHMTIYNNIAFGLQMRKVPKDEIDKRVREAAAILGITDYLERKPKEMSGGQRQRVALGRAIVREPKVMLLDEPLSNLDAKLRTQMRSEIVKLHKKLGTTFIYVTHDQVEAMTMGTRIVVMKDGWIQQTDTPRNLYKYPANKFVAGFIGTPQMNFFEGTLLRDKETVRIAFSGSDAEITAPYSAFTKVEPKYLNGDVPVIIGLRAEDISLDAEKVADAAAVIKIKVSHTEELGTETLVYGNIDLNVDDFSDTSTRIVVKCGGFRHYASDSIMEAALDIGAVHLFDRQTENSILPRIPDANYIDCTVAEGKISFLGVSADLPTAIRPAAGDAELIVPPDAVFLDGDIPVNIIGNERISDKVYVSVKVGDRTLYAESDKEQPVGPAGIRFDFKKLSLRTPDGVITVRPLPEINVLRGGFCMIKNKSKEGKKTIRTRTYCACIDGKTFDVPESVYMKLFAALPGRKVYNSEFDYEFTPYDLKISDEGADGLVEETIDYGTELFAKVKVGEFTLYVRVDSPVSGAVKVAPDFSAVSIVEKERGIRLV